MISLNKSLKERQFPQVIALFLLVLLLLLGTVPGYLSGRFSWQQPAPIQTLKQLKEIRHKGLPLPGWKILQQQEQEIGGRKWSLQVIKGEDSPSQAILLLLPQNGPKDQPQVEWVEISNSWRWNTAQHRPVEFTVKQSNNSTSKVEAHFFRAFSNQETFAVLQWYAMPNGGNPSPSHWFWTDQFAQWQRKRSPWVAVSIMIPMETLGQVDKIWNQAKSLGEAVQSELIKDIFTASKG
jgi:cyanoexosortase B-associated protein